MKILAASLLLSSAIAGAEPIRDGAFLGEFVAARQSIAPGETIDLALRIQHDKGFHTYWKQPGIVGVATDIDWKGTSGLIPGDILWPQPQRIKMGPYSALGHEGETFLIVPFSAPADAKPGSTAKLLARVSFMICPSVLGPGKTCYPGFVDIEFTLPVTEKPGSDTKWAKPILDTRATFPRANRTFEASASRVGKDIMLKLVAKAGAKIALPKSLYFFSSDGQIHSDIEQRVKRAPGGEISLQMTASEFGPKNPTHLAGILFTQTGLPDGSGATPIAFNVQYGKP